MPPLFRGPSRLFLCAVVISLASCGVKSPPERTLRAVGDANFPPFTFLEGEEPRGFVVDLLRAVAEKKNLRVDIHLMGWSAAMDEVRSGKADLLIGVSDLEDRRAYLAFSDRMLTMRSLLFVPEGSYAYTRPEDLKGVVVGVERGDIVAEYLGRVYPNILLREYETQSAAVEALASGEIPVAALDYYSGLRSLQRLNLQGQVKVIGDPLLESAYCFGARKGNESVLFPINDGLETLKGDGTVRDLQERWIGLTPVSSRYRRYTLYGLSALGGLAAVLLIWNLSLRVAVRRRTQELRESLEQFRLYMEYSPVYMFFKDESLVYRALSRNFEDLLGLPLAQLQGKRASEYYSPDIAERIDEADRQVLEGGQPVESILEIGGRTFKTIRFPIHRVGRPTCLAGFYIDVTEEMRSKEELLASLRDKEALLRELYHRTRNTLQVIGSLLMLQAAEYPENGELQDLVASAEDRIGAIALVHQLLFEGRDLSRVSAREYIQALCSNLLENHGVDPGRVRLEVDVSGRPLLLDVAIPLGLLIDELVTNSCKHAFPEGRPGTIRVSLLDREPGRSVFRYSDDGVGADFDLRTARSLGLRLIQTIAERQLLGVVTMENRGGLICVVDFRSDLYGERV